MRELEVCNQSTYFQYAIQLTEKFKQISLVYVPQKENQIAYVLSNLAASLTLLNDKIVNVLIFHRWVLFPYITRKGEC